MEMIMVIMMVLLILVVIGVEAVYVVGLWKLFKKAGKNGWEAIIPFYNTWVLAEVSGIAWWYALIVIISSLGVFTDGFLAMLLSLASLGASIFIYYNLSKKFNKDITFTVLLVIFPVIMIPLLGLSKDCQYDASVVVSENGPIASKNSTGKRFCQHCGKEVNSNSKFCGSCGNQL